MNDTEFKAYCDGFEHLSAGLLKLCNAATSGYRVGSDYVFLVSKETRDMVDSCVNDTILVLRKICDGYGEKE